MSPSKHVQGNQGEENAVIMETYKWLLWCRILCLNPFSFFRIIWLHIHFKRCLANHVKGVEQTIESLLKYVSLDSTNQPKIFNRVVINHAYNSWKHIWGWQKSDPLTLWSTVSWIAWPPRTRTTLASPTLAATKTFLSSGTTREWKPQLCQCACSVQSWIISLELLLNTWTQKEMTPYELRQWKVTY